MRKHISFKAALLVGLVVFTNRIKKVSAVETDSFLLFRHDERVIIDSINFISDNIPFDQSWVVAKVEPDKGSPSDRDSGVHFDKDGHLVVEQNTQIHTIRTEFGKIQLLQSLSGRIQNLDTYKWEYENKIRISSIDEDDMYSIFSGGSGGTAIFRVNDTVEGKEKFRPVYLLADQWVPFVQPAFKYLQAHKEAFDSDNVSEYREQLQQLLLDPNPFLAIAAARTLGEAHQLDAAFVQGPLTQSKGLEQSVFSFLLIQQLPRTKRLDLGDGQLTPQKLNDAVAKATTGETPTENLAAFIDGAKDAETLKAVTVGLAALLNSRDSGIFTQARVEGLLRHIIQRQKTLNTHTEADAYLNASPILMFLRQPPNATNAPK